MTTNDQGQASNSAKGDAGVSVKVWNRGSNDASQEERLRRISRENDRDQDGLIAKWLKLADRLVGKDEDDDMNPQAA